MKRMNWMISFLLAMMFVAAVAQGDEERPKYKVVEAKGKSFLDQRRAKPGMLAGVGGIFEAKGGNSFIDISFLGAIFRLMEGQISVLESNPKKKSPEKMLLEKGKAFFYVDNQIGKNLFHMATSLFIVTVDGMDLDVPVKGVLEVTKEKTVVYVLEGKLDVTIARINKKYAIPVKAGYYLESRGKDDPKPMPFENITKKSLWLDIINPLGGGAR